MRIKFFAPLNRIFGPIKELEFPNPVSVAEVLSLLRDQEPDFALYAGHSPADKHAWGLLVWRGKNLLNLNDILSPDDEIEMIIMVAGG